MFNKVIVLAVLISSAVLAQKGGGVGGGGGGGVTPPGLGEVRVPNEKIPAGGTVQMKFSLTQPRPISTGGPSVAKHPGFSVNGVAATSLLGDAAGVALDQNGALAISVISPNSDFGANLDYPFLTVAMTLPSSAAPGTTYPLGFADTAVQSPAGPLTLSVTKPGVLTVGGSLSIHGVTPGGGTWPAGTLIRLQGSGFQAGTKIVTKMKTSRFVVISPNEIRFALTDITTLDSQPITATNPDASVVTYFSYLRGVPVYAPARALLQNTEPIFPTQVHASANFSVHSSQSGQFTALAFQNPNADSVSIIVSNARSGVASLVVVPSCGRLMDDLQSLLSGSTVNAGDLITVLSTAPIQMLGITADENAGSIAPFLPSF
jgi:hypothetical protein